MPNQNPNPSQSQSLVVVCLSCRLYLPTSLPERRVSAFRVAHMHGGRPSGWTRVMKASELPEGCTAALGPLELLAVVGREEG